MHWGGQIGKDNIFSLSKNYWFHKSLREGPSQPGYFFIPRSGVWAVCAPVKTIVQHMDPRRLCPSWCVCVGGGGGGQTNDVDTTG